MLCGCSTARRRSQSKDFKDLEGEVPCLEPSFVRFGCPCRPFSSFCPPRGSHLPETTTSPRTLEEGRKLRRRRRRSSVWPTDGRAHPSGAAVHSEILVVQKHAPDSLLSNGLRWAGEINGRMRLSVLQQSPWILSRAKVGSTPLVKERSLSLGIPLRSDLLDLSFLIPP